MGVVPFALPFKGGTVDCRVFGEGDDLYAAMLTDIARAHTVVRLESYILAADEVGWSFARALAERARAGLRVQVLVDSAGALFEGTGKLFRFLRGAGVDARLFNRWEWRDPLRYNRRNHRKLLITDEESVYIGGFNIHRESSLAQVGSGRWRDVHIRVAGGVAGAAIELFDATWSGTTSRAVPPWVSAMRLVPNETAACRRVLRCLVLEAVTGARLRVFLATPYFVPDRGLRAALVGAVDRGVDVRILLPHTTDHPLLQKAGRAMARRLARKGVSFFEYLPRMMHSKLMIVDGRWACVGSANTDYRSFFVNRELNLVTTQPAACASLESLLTQDFAESRQLTPSEQPASRLSAMTEAVVMRFRRWL